MRRVVVRSEGDCSNVMRGAKEIARVSLQAQKERSNLMKEDWDCRVAALFAMTYRTGLPRFLWSLAMTGSIYCVIISFIT
jgi:hypothetical protein